MGKSRIGAFQRFLHCKKVLVFQEHRFLCSKDTGFLCSKNARFLRSKNPGILCSKNTGGICTRFLGSRNTRFLQERVFASHQIALAAVSRCLRRFYFFKTETLFYTNPGGVVQVASGVSIFLMDPLKTKVPASLYRLPLAGCFFEKGTLQKHKSWCRCTGCLRRVDFLKHGPL